ncbi:MAG: hypothetical protein LC660_18695 [Desulfobacteraceae bacterium]|nr:hypothetical protein [Desulfobacteraceae bacterium]
MAEEFRVQTFRRVYSLAEAPKEASNIIQRNGSVTRLLKQELKDRDNSLATACRAANRDKALEQEIDEWQAFEDGIEE